jgi:hypothetical protein
MSGPDAAGSAAQVVLGAQGFQGRGYERRGIGRYAKSYINVVCAESPSRVKRIDVDPELPVPAGLVPGDRPVNSSLESAAYDDDAPLVSTCSLHSIGRSTGSGPGGRALPVSPWP